MVAFFFERHFLIGLEMNKLMIRFLKRMLRVISIYVLLNSTLSQNQIVLKCT